MANIESQLEEFDEQRKAEAIEEGDYEEPNNERRWRLSYLKNQFESLELDNLFNRYIERISHGYFSQFLSLQILLITSHFIVLLVEVKNLKEILPDLISYGLISLLSIILLIITDTYVKGHPKLLKILAGIVFVTIFFINAFIPFYNRKRPPDGNLRPAYSTYIIISNYIFLNIQNDLVALIIGLFVSIFHLVTLILVTYEDTDKLYQRLGSDIIYLICINGLGMYFRYMNEIVIRRSFLDRRSCIESTHRLKFEVEQENHLMSSIIPQHIIEKVREPLMRYILDSRKSRSILKQFEEVVEEHSNVTILFADIVNYTAMTTQLDVIDLLEVLNELFGSFDDASEELKVLRIKFLGDCYYCVAGLPSNPVPNHAEACVDLGLKMISIIADIRHRKNLNINMRIGIHTGKISCGIIGTIKWQYDIWSKDVDIANKMETLGTAGMVHITKATKDRLRKPYKISPSNKTVNGEETFLIVPSRNKPQTVPNGIENNATIKEESEIDAPIPNNRQPHRPSIFIKRVSTAPNDLKSTIRSFSLISNYSKEENCDINIETDLTNGKRHTFPNSNERRQSGNPGLGIFQGRSSGNARISTDRRLTGNGYKRRTAFMNNNIKRYKEGFEETNKELGETIENMRLSKYEQWFKATDMYRLILSFKDLRSELEFLKMPDPLFKYYLLGEVILLILVFVLENLTLSKWDWPTPFFYTTLGLIIFIALPASWTDFLWSKYVAKNTYDRPTNILILSLYNLSKFITKSTLSRFVIYTVLYVLFCMCVLTEWLDCYHVATSSPHNSTLTKHSFMSLILKDNINPKTESETQCIIPWHMTETCALAILTSFLFLRMHMWVKLFYAAAIASIYSYCVLNYSGEFFGDSQTYNYSLLPSTSHVMSVFFLTLILHLIDRQTEYMNRTDHSWYKTLIYKEKQVSDVNKVNNVLLRNILPIHVANIYLNLNRHSSDEVYHENYDNAAVMFASITNFSVEDLGESFLKTMSTIISAFDVKLVEGNFGREIEKIKIAKWTYMAACGLAPGLGNFEIIRNDPRGHVVISLLKFAVSLMQALQNINEGMGLSNELKMKLRIGISHGAVAAGVVGSKKPVYDIWGDPVNMASRMDTTGQSDHIQVLQGTAEIIQMFGYVCKYRGEIRVKGVENLVPTYFVALDDDYNLIKRDNTD